MRHTSKFMCLVLALAICQVIVGCESKPQVKTHGFTKVLYNLNDSLQESAFYSRFQYPDNPNHYLGKEVPKDSTYYVFWAGIYQDSLYKVYGHCVGEFGGSAVFQRINDSSKIHLLSLTCPQQIERYDSTYVIMSTLAHMAGHSSIISINNLESCYTLPTDSVIKELMSSNDSIYRLLNGQFANRHKCDTLIDIVGYVFNITFMKDNERYVVCSDDYNTLLGRIQDKELIIIDTLLHYPSWSFNDYGTVKVGGKYLYKYSGHQSVHYSVITEFPIYRFGGMIAVVNDTILIGHRESFFRSWEEMDEVKSVY